MSAPSQILAFDLYGTLLSTESIAHKLGQQFGQDKGPALAATWRKYQLEYTWRLNSMNIYQPFSEVTRQALLNTLAENKLSLSPAELDNFMQAYDSLNVFPDVPAALSKIKADSSLVPVVFSNGTKSMVSNSVNKSADLSPHAAMFKDLIVIEDVKKFKPDPQCYHMLARKVGKPETKSGMSEMWLISGNPFDIVGARSVGMKACWVDRAGNGWADAIVPGETGQPTAIVRSLDEVPDIVKNHAG